MFCFVLLGLVNHSSNVFERMRIFWNFWGRSQRQDVRIFSPLSQVVVNIKLTPSSLEVQLLRIQQISRSTSVPSFEKKNHVYNTKSFANCFGLEKLPANFAPSSWQAHQCSKELIAGPDGVISGVCDFHFLLLACRKNMFFFFS